MSYIGSSVGIEFTTFMVFEFNTMNAATDYQSGDQFYLDRTLAQHLPQFGGVMGLGTNGFFYQQITGDSGNGARLGGFEATTTGIGPVGSFAHEIGKFDFAAEAKLLPELEIANRLSGDTVWFKLGVSWSGSPINPPRSYVNWTLQPHLTNYSGARCALAPTL